MDDERNLPPETPRGLNDTSEPSDDNAPAEAAPSGDAGAPSDQGAGMHYEPNRRFGPRMSNASSTPEVPEGPFGPDVTKISAGTRAGWIALGVLLGVIGLFIVLIIYRRRDPVVFWAALRYVLIGTAIGIILELFLIQTLAGSQAASVAGLSPDAPGWTSTNF